MRKICIVGWSSTMREAPYNDKTWEIWILNHRVDLYPCHDLHFELHNTTNYWGDYLEFLKNNGCKTVVTGIDSRFTEAIVYPKEEIIEKYGDFFTNSMSWMIAYAIEIGATDIGLWGIDCLDRDEYVQQRPSIMFMLGIAKGKGIRLHFPERCKLFRKNKLYWNL